MAAIVEPVEFAQDTLPVCPCSWRRNPYRLVSLWDIMKPFYPAIFTTLCHSMNVLGAGSMPELAAATFPIEIGAQMSNNLPKQRQYCAEVGLIASIATIDKLLAVLSKPDSTFGQVQELGYELQARLHDELFGTFFFSLTYLQSEYYSCPTKGWEEVTERFPTTITDIEEMGKCFALSRYAGAVFHSVQAIECGLIEFGKFLKVNDPKSGWTAVTKRLETLVIKTRYPDLDPLYQQHFSLIEQMHGTVGALNSAWRNKISHAQGRLGLMTSEFSAEVAEEIMVASRSFMRRLAAELPI